MRLSKTRAQESRSWEVGKDRSEGRKKKKAVIVDSLLLLIANYKILFVILCVFFVSFVLWIY